VWIQKLLEELESLEVPAEIREARLESLKQEAAQFALMHEKKHGEYTYVDRFLTVHVDVPTSFLQIILCSEIT